MSETPPSKAELDEWHRQESEGSGIVTSADVEQHAAKKLNRSDFMKDDADKARPELIPPGFVMMTGEVFAYGARKYSEDNWQKCEDARRYIGAALRHVLQYAEGEVLDEESGLPHLGHATASIAMLWGISEGKQ